MKRKAIDENDSAVIRKLQENLLLIRTALGWTADDLSHEIGVTKQTVSNLENMNCEMTKTQYLAITSVIDMELAERNDPKLTRTIYKLLDEEDTLSSADSSLDIAKAALVATAVTAPGALFLGGPLLPILGLTGLAISKNFTKKEKKNGKKSN